MDIRDNQILIIEDNESIVNLYKKILFSITNREINPKVINKYKELDEFINKRNVLLRENIALIISESEIENNDIIDKLEILKSYMPASNMYIISNFITIERLKKVLKFGIIDWIEKPIIPDEFYKIVDESLFKGSSFNKKLEGIEEEIENLELTDEVSYYIIKNKIIKLISENPSRYEGQYFLAKLFERKGFSSLATKHYNAADALK